MQSDQKCGLANNGQLKTRMGVHRDPAAACGAFYQTFYHNRRCGAYKVRKSDKLSKERNTQGLTEYMQTVPCASVARRLVDNLEELDIASFPYEHP